MKKKSILYIEGKRDSNEKKRPAGFISRNNEPNIEKQGKAANLLSIKIG